MQTKAYQLIAWQQPPELRAVDVREPGPGEVLIKVGGAGTCRTDLNLMGMPAGAMPYTLPFTLGHETAGWVEALGAGVTGLERGEPVLVYGPWGCGRCGPCRQGAENHCERVFELRSHGGGVGRDGGLAHYLLVPSSRLLVPLGSLDPRDAAPLTDAALTPYHAIKKALPLLVPGSTAVVIGAGGLGQMALQLLSALSPTRVIAVDASPEKLARARELGVPDAVLADTQTAAHLRELTHGRGAELVLDLVGTNETLALAAQALRPRGQLTLVGLSGGVLPFHFFALPLECQVVAPYWGTLPELMEVLALAEAGRLRMTVERFPLERVAEAYQRMREGTLKGRAVITPHG
ncbi:NAD(P)-dependent alcohol dehydrogenase [Stigmatella aurantiaca]|uniref:alcohol dehydrogenase n=1 Tax=Stigmatella aurantiaca (strain DW4/3-1) TaxID=378806 RepID=E3FZR5_STIAD|nr:NAD(P)-dependent alcohol dehydrogenase [Stigmatella aurantiaca]ADO69930.1 Alcohol dehydrogenase GroES domain protein [Stigmatella aurantiaca DW4/3-1]